MPVLTDAHVAEAIFQVGQNHGEVFKLSTLSSGARGLLVAMTCYGVCDTFVKLGVKAKDIGATPMNLSQIRRSFATLIDVKRQCRGITIGHECSERNIRTWVSELHDCGLIKGGVRGLRGTVANSRGKSGQVKRDLSRCL